MKISSRPPKSHLDGNRNGKAQLCSFEWLFLLEKAVGRSQSDFSTQAWNQGEKTDVELAPLAMLVQNICELGYNFQELLRQITLLCNLSISG